METLGDILRKANKKIGEVLYYRFGKPYVKLNRNEAIKKGAMQSWRSGELQPITNADGETIGHTPSEFSDERDFYNPIEESEPQTILGLEVIDHHEDYDPWGVGFGHGQMILKDIERHINKIPTRRFFLAKTVTAIDSNSWLDDADWKEKTITAFDSIPLEDPVVLKEIGEGKTVG